MIFKKLILLILMLGAMVNVCHSQQVSDPDAARFSQEIETFQQWDAKNSYPENGILFVGSSSIRMWKTHQAFPDLPVINRGFGGAHISDIQHYYEQVIGKYAPSVIVFYAGDNDIADGKPIQQVIGDYKDITDQILNDFHEAKFVYIPIKPSSSRWSYWPDMAEVNRQIREYNQQQDPLYYVDLATPLLKPDGTPNDSLFIDDLLHLNEKGYAAWNQVIAPRLKELYQSN